MTTKDKQLLKENPLYAGTQIRTYTGKYIDVFNFKEEDIDIEDIIIALSRAPRFGGHMKKQISVLRHTFHVISFLKDKKNILAALLHDASEAYLCDLPKPIKDALPGYKELEDKVMKVITKKFRFEYPLNEDVKNADKLALEYEFLHFKLQYKWQDKIKDFLLLRNNKWILKRRFRKFLKIL